MKILPLGELCYTDASCEIFDIFPESWTARREFSLYKSKPRPCGAFFFVCSELRASFFLEDRSVIAKRGDVVWIPAQSRYWVFVDGASSTGIDTYTVNCCLRDERGEAFGLSDTIAILANRQDNGWEVRLKKLFGAWQSGKDGHAEGRRNLMRLKGECLLLLNSVAEASTRMEDGSYPIRRGIELFCEEWNQNEKIEKYAALCGVSVTYFYRCFRKWAGKSPVEYRNALRLSNADSLLRCTDMRISEIARAVGFEDPFYFCRIFSKEFGVSPQAYRNRIDA